MGQDIISNVLQNLRSFRQVVVQNNQFCNKVNDLDAMLADAEEPLLIMVMGEFSTGKSTFINALVGREVAVMNATPTTAVITKLCYGIQDEIIVHFLDGTEERKTSQEFAALTAEADEESNKIHETIDYVERRIPLDALKAITIIDSPGLNAIKDAHGIVTRRFMDKADSVWWLLSAENAGSQTEIEAMEELSPRLKPFALVNKMDQVDEEEESPEELLDNIRGLLGDHVQKVIGISAKLALQGKLDNNPAMLEESRLAEFYKVIEDEVLPHRESYKMNTLLDDMAEFTYSIGSELEKQEQKAEELKTKDYAAYIKQETELAPIKDGLEELAGIFSDYCQNQRKNMTANVFMGNLYRFGLGVEKAEDKAVQLWEKAAVRHDRKALSILVWHYDDKGDIDKTLFWIQQGADEGIAFCQAQLGLFFFAGKNIEQDTEKALAYFKRAAAQDDAMGHFGEGFIYLYGLGVKRDVDYAWKCLQKAAAQHFSKAFYELGNCCQYGWGTDADAVRMAEYYQKAVDGGNKDALEELGRCYAEGIGVAADIDKALSYLLQAAENESAEALTYLGDLYKYGELVAQDLKKAFSYYKRSAELGDAKAQFELSRCYCLGEGTTQDSKAERDWLQKSVKQNYPWALYQQGLYLEQGNGMQKDENQAFKMFEQAAKDLYCAKLRLAECWNFGYLNAKKDLPRAIEIYQEGIAHGVSQAKYRMAMLYREGNGVAKALKKYLQLVTEAAKEGLPMAQRELGRAYYMGDNVPLDYEKAFYWLEKAAPHESDAMYVLAECYLNGTGTKKNVKKAIDWMQQAAEHGVPYAQLDLAYRYREGDGVAKNENTAFRWLQKAAGQGIAEADNLLGIFYWDGIGVKEDADNAFVCFKKAAEQDYAWGYFNLGEYYQSVGNNTQAISCFQKAADKGITDAFVELGYFEESRNKEKAFSWYKKAADAGLAEGQYNLGRCYEQGIGAAKDEFVAEYWYKKAAKQDCQEAKDALNNLRERREKRRETEARHEQAEKRIAALKQRAAGGDMSAQYELGNNYLALGDPTKACQWFCNAANQGLAEAQFMYGKCLVYGQGTAQDIPQGIKWLVAAAEQGDLDAEQLLSELNQAEQEKQNQAKDEESSGGGCGCLVVLIILFLLSKIFK